MADLIRLEQPLAIVRAAIWSGRVAGVNPVSVLLVATPESAKSQILAYYRDTSTLRYYTDVTAKPLLLLKEPIEKKQIRHIVLQDLTTLEAHRGWVAQRIFAVLGVLIEDGATTIADPSGQIQWEGMPKIGLIAAITPELYRDHRWRWARTGFLSRFLSIHFTYREETADEIHGAIREGHEPPEAHPQNLPDQEVEIDLAKDHAEAIEVLARQLAERYHTYGFRYHRALRALAKGRALSCGRTKVSAEDIAQLTRWAKFFDDSKPHQI